MNQSYGEELVGISLYVCQAGSHEFRLGTVRKYHSKTRKHLLAYGGTETWENIANCDWRSQGADLNASHLLRNNSHELQTMRNSGRD